jgi:hypothetical protein
MNTTIKTVAISSPNGYVVSCHILIPLEHYKSCDIKLFSVARMKEVEALRDSDISNAITVINGKEYVRFSIREFGVKFKDVSHISFLLYNIGKSELALYNFLTAQQ